MRYKISQYWAYIMYLMYTIISFHHHYPPLVLKILVNTMLLDLKTHIWADSGNISFDITKFGEILSQK